MNQVFTPDMAEDIRNATDILRRGGVIIYPTDTVWGIGCDATDSRAVRRIFEIKRRSDSKALITLVDSLAMLERTVEDVPEVAEQLVEVAIEPITVVYDHGRGVAPELLAEDGSIGVRLTREPFSAALCRNLRRPIVSTSANLSGEPTPLDFASIPQDILEAADYVCRSRRNDPPAVKSSSVIKISDGGLFKIIRK